MIGSYPIGTFPYGRAEQEQGVSVVLLGNALANASALDATTYVRFVLQATAAQSTAQSLGSNIGIGMSTAGATASASELLSKVFLQLGLADSISSANDAATQLILVSQSASADASALDTALAITLGLDPTSSTAQALNAQPKTLLDLGLAGTDAEANAIITKSILLATFAHAIASGESIDGLQIRLKIGRADADAVGLDAVPRTILEIGQTTATSSANNITGIGIAVLPASAIVNANDVIPKSFLDMGSADSDAEALVIIPLVGLNVEPAQSDSEALSISGIGLGTFIADAIAKAEDPDINYIVDGVPDIIVTRSVDLTENVLKVLNENAGNINIYRADDHRGLFELLAQNQLPEYTDSSLDDEINYKYKAAFVITGTKGGQSVVAEGEKSLPRYTIGNKTL